VKIIWSILGIVWPLLIVVLVVERHWKRRKKRFFYTASFDVDFKITRPVSTGGF
jgi:hypothetical protein